MSGHGRADERPVLADAGGGGKELANTDADGPFVDPENGADERVVPPDINTKMELMLRLRAKLKRKISSFNAYFVCSTSSTLSAMIDCVSKFYFGTSGKLSL